MSVSSFLFEGTPNVGTNSTVSSMPQWMADYAQSLLTGAAGAGAEPYQPYTGPRIAGLTEDQENAYDMTRSAVNGPTPMSAAAPYLNTAGKTFTGQNVNDYMSPYISNVTDRAAQLAGRAYKEQIIPQLEGKFGALGGDTRSSAYRSAAERGSRDVMENLNAQNLATLNQGYTNAGSQFSSDAGRAAQLAPIASTIAQNTQRQGLEGAGALQAMGQEQQGQTQKSLDLAKQDFDTQRDYPWQQLSRMANLGNGLLTPEGTKTSTTSGGQNGYSATGLDTIGGVTTGITGLLKLLQNQPTAQARRGGHITVNRMRPRPQFAMGGALRFARA